MYSKLCILHIGTKSNLGLSEIPGLVLAHLSSKALCELLLFGNELFKNIDNNLILEATVSFILSTVRLE